jgi:hypothetical protein
MDIYFVVYRAKRIYDDTHTVADIDIDCLNISFGHYYMGRCREKLVLIQLDVKSR